MGDPLVSRVARFVRDLAALRPGEGVLALVSGGADSVCLMHLLPRVHAGPVEVVSFDHGLRPEAAAEAARVVAQAEGAGLVGHRVALDLAPGPGVQERARDARYAAARALAARRGLSVLAVGHTASDQAETVLFRIARGTGRSGALGMAPRSGDLVRPLLCVDAAETRDWCAEHGIVPVDDPGNRDAAYARARVRHDLLPALRRVHPGAERAVARFADQLRDEAWIVEAALADAWARCARGDGLDAGRLGMESPALARLLVRRLIAREGLPLDAAWIERILETARRPGRPCQVPGGLVAVDRGVLVAEAGPPPRPPGDAALAVPGAVRFGDAFLRARPGAAPGPAPGRVALRVDGPFEVRAPRPGDRLGIGGGHSRAVGRLLADAGVPARHRVRVPVVTCAGRVVWVAGYRADPALLAAPDAPATVLEVTPA
jgi:tRNA(Ile)-lysidine synthase